MLHDAVRAQEGNPRKKLVMLSGMRDVLQKITARDEADKHESELLAEMAQQMELAKQRRKEKRKILREQYAQQQEDEARKRSIDRRRSRMGSSLGNLGFVAHEAIRNARMSILVHVAKTEEEEQQQQQRQMDTSQPPTHNDDEQAPQIAPQLPFFAPRKTVVVVPGETAPTSAPFSIVVDRGVIGDDEPEEGEAEKTKNDDDNISLTSTEPEPEEPSSSDEEDRSILRKSTAGLVRAASSKRPSRSTNNDPFSPEAMEAAAEQREEEELFKKFIHGARTGDAEWVDHFLEGDEATEFKREIALKSGGKATADLVLNSVLGVGSPLGPSPPKHTFSTSSSSGMRLRRGPRDDLTGVTGVIDELMNYTAPNLVLETHSKLCPHCYLLPERKVVRAETKIYTGIVDEDERFPPNVRPMLFETLDKDMWEAVAYYASCTEKDLGEQVKKAMQNMPATIVDVAKLAAANGEGAAGRRGSLELQRRVAANEGSSKLKTLPESTKAILRLAKMVSNSSALLGGTGVATEALESLVDSASAADKRIVAKNRAASPLAGETPPDPNAPQHPQLPPPTAAVLRRAWLLRHRLATTLDLGVWQAALADIERAANQLKSIANTQNVRMQKKVNTASNELNAVTQELQRLRASLDGMDEERKQQVLRAAKLELTRLEQEKKFHTLKHSVGKNERSIEVRQLRCEFLKAKLEAAAVQHAELNRIAAVAASHLRHYDSNAVSDALTEVSVNALLSSAKNAAGKSGPKRFQTTAKLLMAGRKAALLLKNTAKPRNAAALAARPSRRSLVEQTIPDITELTNTELLQKEDELRERFLGKICENCFLFCGSTAYCPRTGLAHARVPTSYFQANLLKPHTKAEDEVPVSSVFVRDEKRRHEQDRAILALARERGSSIFIAPQAAGILDTAYIVSKLFPGKLAPVDRTTALPGVPEADVADPMKHAVDAARKAIDGVLDDYDDMSSDDDDGDEKKRRRRRHHKHRSTGEEGELDPNGLASWREKRRDRRVKLIEDGTVVVIGDGDGLKKEDSSQANNAAGKQPGYLPPATYVGLLLKALMQGPSADEMVQMHNARPFLDPVVLKQERDLRSMIDVRESFKIGEAMNMTGDPVVVERALRREIAVMTEVLKYAHVPVRELLVKTSDMEKVNSTFDVKLRQHIEKNMQLRRELQTLLGTLQRQYKEEHQAALATEASIRSPGEPSLDPAAAGAPQPPAGSAAAAALATHNKLGTMLRDITQSVTATAKMQRNLQALLDRSKKRPSMNQPQQQQATASTLSDAQLQQQTSTPSSHHLSPSASTKITPPEHPLSTKLSPIPHTPGSLALPDPNMDAQHSAAAAAVGIFDRGLSFAARAITPSKRLTPSNAPLQQTHTKSGLSRSPRNSPRVKSFEEEIAEIEAAMASQPDILINFDESAEILARLNREVDDTQEGIRLAERLLRETATKKSRSPRGLVGSHAASPEPTSPLGRNSGFSSMRSMKETKGSSTNNSSGNASPATAKLVSVRNTLGAVEKHDEEGEKIISALELRRKLVETELRRVEVLTQVKQRHQALERVRELDFKDYQRREEARVAALYGRDEGPSPEFAARMQAAREALEEAHKRHAQANMDVQMALNRLRMARMEAADLEIRRQQHSLKRADGTERGKSMRKRPVLSRDGKSSDSFSNTVSFNMDDVAGPVVALEGTATLRRKRTKAATSSSSQEHKKKKTKRVARPKKSQSDDLDLQLTLPPDASGELVVADSEDLPLDGSSANDDDATSSTSRTSSSSASSSDEGEDSGADPQLDDAASSGPGTPKAASPRNASGVDSLASTARESVPTRPDSAGTRSTLPHLSSMEPQKELGKMRSVSFDQRTRNDPSAPRAESNMEVEAEASAEDVDSSAQVDSDKPSTVTASTGAAAPTALKKSSKKVSVMPQLPNAKKLAAIARGDNVSAARLSGDSDNDSVDSELEKFKARRAQQQRQTQRAAPGRGKSLTGAEAVITRQRNGQLARSSGSESEPSRTAVHVQQAVLSGDVNALLLATKKAKRRRIKEDPAVTAARIKAEEEKKAAELARLKALRALEGTPSSSNGSRLPSRQPASGGLSSPKMTELHVSPKDVIDPQPWTADPTPSPKAASHSFTSAAQPLAQERTVMAEEAEASATIGEVHGSTSQLLPLTTMEHGDAPRFAPSSGVEALDNEELNFSGTATLRPAASTTEVLPQSLTEAVVADAVNPTSSSPPPTAATEEAEKKPTTPKRPSTSPVRRRWRTLEADMRLERTASVETMLDRKAQSQAAKAAATTTQPVLSLNRLNISQEVVMVKSDSPDVSLDDPAAIPPSIVPTGPVPTRVAATVESDIEANAGAEAQRLAKSASKAAKQRQHQKELRERGEAAFIARQQKAKRGVRPAYLALQHTNSGEAKPTVDEVPYHPIPAQTESNTIIRRLLGYHPAPPPVTEPLLLGANSIARRAGPGSPHLAFHPQHAGIKLEVLDPASQRAQGVNRTPSPDAAVPSAAESRRPSVGAVSTSGASVAPSVDVAGVPPLGFPTLAPVTARTETRRIVTQHRPANRTLSLIPDGVTPSTPLQPAPPKTSSFPFENRSVPLAGSPIRGSTVVRRTHEALPAATARRVAKEPGAQLTLLAAGTQPALTSRAELIAKRAAPQRRLRQTQQAVRTWDSVVRYDLPTPVAPASSSDEVVRRVLSANGVRVTGRANSSIVGEQHRATSANANRSFEDDIPEELGEFEARSSIRVDPPPVVAVKPAAQSKGIAEDTDDDGMLIRATEEDGDEEQDWWDDDGDEDEVTVKVDDDDSDDDDDDGVEDRSEAPSDRKGQLDVSPVMRASTAQRRV